MGETTKGFKMSDEAKDTLNNIIAASGLTDKDWIDAATTLWILQDSKGQLTGFKTDIDELTLHTNRINELVLNIIKRTSFEKDEVIRVSSDQINEIIAEKERLISDNADLKKAVSETHKFLESSNSNILELKKTIEQLENAVTTEKMLISEYKDKNDMLTGLLSDYKGSHAELIECKRILSDTQIESAEWQSKCLRNEGVIKENVSKHAIEIDRITEKLSLQYERELLKLETDYQRKLDSLRTEFSSKTQSLYSDIEILRTSEFNLRSEKRELEIKLEQLLNSSND